VVNAINRDITKSVTIGIQTTQTTNKDKKEVVMNGVLAQTNGGIWNKFGNRGGHR
jgi:hypothetical protein